MVCWVAMRARWWTNSVRTDVVHIQSKVMLAVKRAFDDAGIDMPYETQVHLWHDQTEENDGVRAKQREGWPTRPDEEDPKPRFQPQIDSSANSSIATKARSPKASKNKN